MLLLVLVLCVVDVGDGAGVALPIVGMSPAKAEADRAQVRSSAIVNRFIRVFSCFKNYQKSGISRYQISGIGK
jgi:hypothetical protein